MERVPLRDLHSELNPVKLRDLDRMSTAEIMASLGPGRRDGLKCRADGTVLDGHHRVAILRARGVDVDALPREVMERESYGDF